MSVPSAVVLLSGGLDSAVCLKATLDSMGPTLALTFDYGQRARAREAEASRGMCERLGAAHRVVELPWLAEITRTALVNGAQALPEVDAAELDDSRVTGRSAEAVWVPNRNGVFVMVAAAFAEALGAGNVVAGFNAEEGASFPDNSPAFVEAMRTALSFSTLSKVHLASPTNGLTKTQIVRLGRDIGAALDLIWSCYDGGEEPCWQCESCRRLRRALVESGSWEWWQEERGRARSETGAGGA